MSEYLISLGQAKMARRIDILLAVLKWNENAIRNNRKSRRSISRWQENIAKLEREIEEILSPEEEVV